MLIELTFCNTQFLDAGREDHAERNFNWQDGVTPTVAVASGLKSKSEMQAEVFTAQIKLREMPELNYSLSNILLRRAGDSLNSLW
jgi:hypothetical protein